MICTSIRLNMSLCSGQSAILSFKRSTTPLRSFPARPM
jgi:hypothetical protein